MGYDYVLKQEDVPYLVEILTPMSHKWQELGIVLHLHEHVRKQCKSDENIISLTNVLSNWVLGNGITPVTLGQLKEKVKSKVVGYGVIAQQLTPNFKNSSRAAVQSSASHDQPSNGQKMDSLVSKFMSLFEWYKFRHDYYGELEQHNKLKFCRS